MPGKDYSTTITVSKSPKEVFDAVNNVRGWWSERIKGETDKLGAEFEFEEPGFHWSVQKITEMVPNKRVVWRVTDSQIKFVKEKTEWKGTDVIFDISKKGEKTELQFTHRGLVPEIECFDACSGGWSHYVGGSLRDLITKGKGYPSKKEK
jgi:hypothetical protein